VEYFVYALTRYSGACTAVLGGLAPFVFTTGVGEPSAMVCAALCKKLAALGEKIDEEADAAEKQRISAADRVVSLGQSKERGTDGRGAHARAHSAGAPVTSVFSRGYGKS
jgi:acetate kinase